MNSEKLLDVKLIYDSLLDVAEQIAAIQSSISLLHNECSQLKYNVKHFMSVLRKDLVIRRPSQDMVLQLQMLEMTIDEWNLFIQTEDNPNHGSDSSSPKSEDSIQEEIS
jgi:hypothetical protein